MFTVFKLAVIQNIVFKTIFVIIIIIIHPGHHNVKHNHQPMVVDDYFPINIINYI